MQTLILPCAGLSTRYPNMRPKYLLTCPNGDLVLKRALDSVELRNIDRIVVVLLKKHEEEYSAIRALKNTLPGNVEYVCLGEPTRGPADTVARAINECGINGNIIVKDSDSFFDSVETVGGSYVGVLDLRKNNNIKNVAAKSFSIINENNIITSIIEKNVVSNYISGGLYGFSDAQEFARCYQHLAKIVSSEIFVSHIVDYLIGQGEVFFPLDLKNLIDVGTVDEWNNFVAAHAVYFVDIDGLLFKNQSRYFSPFWGDEVVALENNINILLERESLGAQLIFATSRPEEFRDVTSSALKKYGFKSNNIIMGLNHGPRYVINDYSSKSNPYPTARAVNVERNSDTLDSVLR